MTTEVHDWVLKQAKKMPGADKLEIPPPVFREMGGQFTEFEPGQAATTRWPIRAGQRGPDGSLQGGVLTAFFDNTFGPLAYLSGEAFYVSLDVTTHFLRGVGPDVDRITVRVRVAGGTERLLLLEGEAERPDGKIVARCHTKMITR